jgi:hypothetical protein
MKCRLIGCSVYTAFNCPRLSALLILCNKMSSHTVAAQGQTSQFDEWNFRRSMNEIGRAYRNQAMELIAICRLFSQAAEQRYMQDAELTR